MLYACTHRWKGGESQLECSLEIVYAYRLGLEPAVWWNEIDSAKKRNRLRGDILAIFPRPNIAVGGGGWSNFQRTVYSRFAS